MHHSFNSGTAARFDCYVAVETGHVTAEFRLPSQGRLLRVAIDGDGNIEGLEGAGYCTIAKRRPATLVVGEPAPWWLLLGVLTDLWTTSDPRRKKCIAFLGLKEATT